MEGSCGHKGYACSSCGGFICRNSNCVVSDHRCFADSARRNIEIKTPPSSRIVLQIAQEQLDYYKGLKPLNPTADALAAAKVEALQSLIDTVNSYQPIPLNPVATSCARCGAMIESNHCGWCGWVDRYREAKAPVTKAPAIKEVETWGWWLRDLTAPNATGFLVRNPERLAIAQPPEEWSITPLYDRPVALAPAAPAPATLAQPLPPFEWLPPPDSKRPIGYRCVVPLEIEWCSVIRERLWAIPKEHSMFKTGEGTPGVFGFLPMEMFRK